MSIFEPTNNTPKFVLVDDNPADLHLMEFAINQVYSDAIIHAFESGEDLIDVWQNQKGMFNQTSACIIDYSMPGAMSAEEVLSFLHTNTPKRTPLFIYSGAVIPSLKRKMIRMGAKDFFEKPTDLHDLVELVKGLISSKLSKV